MNKYSGLKIYTDLEGRLIRVNKYLDGKKTSGVFVPSYLSEDKRGLLNAYLKEQFKDMRFQYGIRIAPPTRSGEDDDSWIWHDDNNGYWNDEYGLPAIADCFFWDYSSNDEDTGNNDDDGYDDSYDPDSDNGYNDWIDDYGNLNQNNHDLNQQDGDKGKFGNKQEKKTLDTKKAKSEFKGYISKDRAKELGIPPRDCFTVAKSVMASFGQTWLHGSAETAYIINLISSENGTAVPLTGSILGALEYITSRLDGNMPVLVGVDYRGNDGEIDHWIVVIGYWATGVSSIELQYVETGTGNSDMAFDEGRILYYSEGDDYISGPHWLWGNDAPLHVVEVRKNP